MGFSTGLLDIIEHDWHHRAEDCCNALWEQWRDINSSATWRKVIQVIGSLEAVHPVAANETLAVACAGMDAAIRHLVFNVSDQMQKFFIKERYKVSEDDWPPYQPEHFTSVALIHHKENYATVKEVIAVASTLHRGSIKAYDNLASPTKNIEQSMDMVLSGEYLMECQSAKDITEIFTPVKDNIIPDIVPNRRRTWHW